MFSRRLDWSRPPNVLAETAARLVASGAEILDLTESNPTHVGLGADPGALRAALAAGDGAAYEPAPTGLASARQAVAAFVDPDQAAVGADDVVLTASSSESYALLFKILADPGDEIAVPEPSYPLFEYLARLEGLDLVPYRLRWDGAWHVDAASCEAALGRPRVRAVVVVSPGNPTGAFLERTDLERIDRLCAARDLALIADEVFADYPLAPGPGAVRRVAREALASSALVLGGLSKSAGMPQLKLGWILIAGARTRRAEIRHRLELVADTYLSVGGPVQRAAAALLEEGAKTRAAIGARITRNLAALRSAVAPEAPFDVLWPEAGWSAVLRVSSVRSDEEWARVLLEADRVLVQPGYFFDMPPGGVFLVLGLLSRPEIFDEGVRRLLARLST